VASSKVDYDPVFPYKVSKAYGWRDPGGTWDDEDLKQGPVPDFDPDANLFVASEVTRRDSLGQVLESIVEDGTARNYSTVFHEGRAALPVGIVTGSRRDNAAVLTAENANVPQLLASWKLDRDGLWDAPGVTYDSAKVHSGRYSFKVTDNFGPSGNLHLKDVQEERFGFIASAWIYGDMDDEPIFSVSWRRGFDSADIREVRAAPVGGSYQRGKWQRWEALISHDSLVAGGMFADESGDFLRFYIGSLDLDTTFSPIRVIYVDDIVLRPDNSVFSLAAYNERGQPTHSTDTHHRTITHEYGFAGQRTVTRDERGRVFGQSGFNKPGENP
jgi:YD repeat-containing protein